MFIQFISTRVGGDKKRSLPKYSAPGLLVGEWEEWRRDLYQNIPPLSRTHFQLSPVEHEIDHAGSWNSTSVIKCKNQYNASNTFIVIIQVCDYTIHTHPNDRPKKMSIYV